MTTGAPAVLIPVLITLRADLLVRVGNDQANRISVPVLPGRVLRGLLAAALRDTPDLLLAEAVRGDHLQVGPAYPVTGTTQVTVAWPTPASWYWQRQGQDRWVVDTLDPDQEEAQEAVRSALLVTSRHGVVPLQVDIPTYVRIQRDRTSGTTGSDTGGPVTDHVIAAGQRFLTWVRVVSSHHQQMRDLLETRVCDPATAHQWHLGASQASAGGDPLFEILNPDQVRVDPAHHSPDQDWPEGQSRTVLLTSATIVTDPDTGELRPDLISDCVHTAWQQLAPESITVDEAWVNTTRHGGYHALYRGFVAERWGAGPGTVVRVTATRTIPAAVVATWLTTPLGQDWVEGCGRHLLLRTDPTVLGDRVATAYPTPTMNQLLLPDGTLIDAPGDPHPKDSPDPALLDLQDRLYTTAADQALTRWAADEHPVTGLSTHLWSRLHDTLLNHGRSGLTDLLADPPPEGGTFASGIKPLAARTRRPARDALAGWDAHPDDPAPGACWTRIRADLEPALAQVHLRGGPCPTPDVWLHHHQDQVLTAGLNAWLLRQRRLTAWARQEKP